MGEHATMTDKERGNRLMVVPDAVIGGGVDLRAGQFVHESDFRGCAEGFVAALLAHGALVFAPEDLLAARSSG
jgi:hypothetical protein